MEVALQIDLVRGGSLQPAFAVSVGGPLFRAFRACELKHMVSTKDIDWEGCQGHASSVVTQTIYEHLLDNSGRAVADEMDRFFGTS